MDSFEGEWDLCSSILSLEDFDFTSIYNNVIPQPDAAAWFCSNLDSFTANFPSSNYVIGNGIIDQFPCNIDHHKSMSIEDNKIMDSIFSASSTTEILLQEISSGFSSDQDKLFVDMDVVQTNATNSVNPLLFHHKRKANVVANDDDHNNLINNVTNNKTRTSNNKNRKGGELKKASSTRRRKNEEERENGEGRSCDMNSCSSDNSSEDDNASQNTNGDEPPKSKARATRGSATDPQSLYARKRRERINERLRILQKLVPNGTKVDISTMLEEAVHYVKFLQLQIKLLSSDDLWMYAPIAYNGMDIGLQQKLSSIC